MDITVLNWLQAKSNNMLENNDLNVIASERGVEDSGSLIAEQSQQVKDLMYADALMAISVLPTTGSKSKEHGGFAQRSSYSLGNQKSNIAIAMSIYKKYADPKYDQTNAGQGSIKTVRIIER